MTAVIVDYGSGNLRSAAKAFEAAARNSGYDGDIRVSASAEAVAKADHIVLPGVGAFADCKAGLAALPGMIEALNEAVLHRGRPFLGICVGMQLLAARGLEHGVHQGLGWLAGDVAQLTPSDPALKVPHMGWNELTLLADHPVLAGIKTGDHAYFVHSYHYTGGDRLAETEYGGRIAAIVGRGAFVGTQFHPEKSQATGLRLIANFLKWRP